MKTLLVVDNSKNIHIKKDQEEDLLIVLLSDDVLVLEDFKTKYPAAQIFQPSSELQSMSEKYRETFVRSIDESYSNILTEKESSKFSIQGSGNLLFYTDWFEKTPIVFKTYPHYLILLYIKEIFEKHNPKELIFSVSDLRLMESLSLTFGKKFETKFDVKIFFRPLKNLYLFLLKKWLLIRFKKNSTIKRKLFFTLFPFYSRDNDKIINNYIKEKGEAQLNGEWSFVGPLLSGTNQSIKNFLKDLKESRNQSDFTFVEKYISVGTFFYLWLKVYQKMLSLYFIKSKFQIRISDIDMSSYFRDFTIISYSSHKILEALLYREALKRISIDNKISDIIYVSENYSYEKEICSFARSEKVNISAYPHFAFGDEHINFYKSSKLSEKYLPDNFLSIGPKVSIRLGNMGWKVEKKEFESFRYGYLNKTLSPPKENGISILLTIDKKNNERIIRLMKKILTKDISRKVYVRSHPGCPIIKLDEAIPSEWILANDMSLSELMLKSKVSVCSQGGVALEALLHQNKVVIFQSNMDLNYLPWGKNEELNVFTIDLTTKTENFVDILNKEPGKFPVYKDYFY